MGGGGNDSGEARYAEYVESYHKALCNTGHDWQTDILQDGRVATYSPYASITVEDPSNAFFGVGFTITSYPSLFSTFETFISDIDINALYNTILDATVNNTTITDAIAAESAMINDEINQVSLPKVNAGMRDINAVMSTGFIREKAFLESQKIKIVSKFSSTLKIAAVSAAASRWSETLKWNMNTVEVYMKLNQLYWASRFDYIDAKAEISQKNLIWPLTVLDFQRSFVGTLQGAIPSPNSGGPSKATKAVGGVLAGAAAGAYIGSVVPGIGTAVGAGIGAVLGLAGGVL